MPGKFYDELEVGMIFKHELRRMSKLRNLSHPLSCFPFLFLKENFPSYFEYLHTRRNEVIGRSASEFIEDP